MEIAVPANYAFLLKSKVLLQDLLHGLQSGNGDEDGGHREIASERFEKE